MTRSTLGALEQQVLLAMMRLGSDTYAVPIVVEIRERTGRDLSHAAVYVALRRMEKRGLLSSRLVPAQADERGRERRYFSLEPDAIALLQETKRALVRLWDDLTELDEA